MRPSDDKRFSFFLKGKSEYSLGLYDHFITEYQKIGNITLHPTKTMIAVSNGERRAAWVTQIGKNFIHVVFPLKKAYPDNLCFQKVGQVPGATQFNHHFRMLFKEDINEEILKFMRIAWSHEK